MAFIESGKAFDKEKHYEKMKQLLADKDTIQYPIRIPKVMHKQIKIKMAQDGTKLREILLQFLEEYLKKS